MFVVRSLVYMVLEPITEGNQNNRLQNFKSKMSSARKCCWCCAINCGRRRTRDEPLKVHSFPRNELLWVLLCNFFTITYWFMICVTWNQFQRSVGYPCRLVKFLAGTLFYTLLMKYHRFCRSCLVPLTSAYGDFFCLNTNVVLLSYLRIVYFIMHWCV